MGIDEPEWSPELLAAIGLLTVRWGGLEAHFDVLLYQMHVDVDGTCPSLKIPFQKRLVLFREISAKRLAEHPISLSRAHEFCEHAQRTRDIRDEIAHSLWNEYKYDEERLHGQNIKITTQFRTRKVSKNIDGILEAACRAGELHDELGRLHILIQYGIEVKVIAN